jgi:two-component system sensor histidine kinase PilS (NtrC family)
MPVTGIAAGNASDTSDWQPLRLLTLYRVVLAGLLTVLYFGLHDSNPFNIQLPGLFRSTLLTYLLFSLAAGFSTRAHWPGYEVQALLQVLADIGAIALLMHASGGVGSAMSILLVVAVVFGALLLPGRLAYLFAAVATLTMLFETGLASLSPEQADASHITRAGLMGAVLFMAAALAHILVIRARDSAALAQQRGVDLANLEQLNRRVVQQLESGLLVLDPDNYVRLANDTARNLLGMHSSTAQRLDRLAPELAGQFRQWQADHRWSDRPVAVKLMGSSVIPRFSELTTSQGTGALILLDDSARLARHTQQLKLASLGRLTASIAHEIRNPLGAISHAAQLLDESDQLNAGDRRLAEIIGNHTRRVNTIIENVLQLSRRSASQPQRLDLGEWLQAFREEFTQSEAIQPQQLQLDMTQESLQVQVDPGHLHQVLTNLCENALRHSADTGAPITLLVRRNETGTVWLDVIDQGRGIDADTADQMFEPFYTTATSGTGLGLYIARELCDINQARLSYHPVNEGGSCFRIQFGQAAA